MKRYQITGISVRLPVSQKEWDIIQKLEAQFIEGPYGHHKLDDVLRRAGADSLEYNGHFGMAIYFMCDNENRAKKIVKLFRKIIKENS